MTTRALVALAAAAVVAFPVAGRADAQASARASAPSSARSSAQAPPGAPAPAEPAWARGATCYEVFVRSFADSDGDGIGDLRGLTARLDHLNDGEPRTTGDLGVRCIWLMPVAESPGYHGYDPSDHYRVERDYGTAEDFARFVAEAHRRGMAVIVDMVLNHVSSEYPAFQRALADPAAPERRFFRFQREKGPPNKWGGDNWHKSPLRDEHYYGFFWHGMPDLDLTNPDALEEMQRVATFWLTEMGVDGFRLDAVKFLVEEGGQVEDTPGTHRVLSAYAAHVRRVKPGAYTIGEVFDSTSALLPYYPDQLDGYFAFEVGDSILAGVRNGRASGILAPALRLQDTLPAWRWSPFLRNHDQPRTVTVLDGDVEKAKVAAVLQLTVPGLPFVYYGEELGMTGPKPDERIRTPMAWTRSGPHAGFTTGRPWQPLAADSLTANVEVQRGDRFAPLTLYRRLIALRSAHPALAAGRLQPLRASDPAVLAYVRRAGDRAVLVVANVGTRPLRGVRLEAPTGSLPAGAFVPREMLTDMAGVRWRDDPDGRTRTTFAPGLTVRDDGSFRGYVPFGTLPARSAWVFDLAPGAGR